MSNPFDILNLRLISIEEAILDLKQSVKSSKNPNSTIKEKGIYLTKQEAAKLLKVSPGSIDNYRRRGQIQSYQIGRNVLFKEEELLAVVEDLANV